jgi:hypothetical protein
LGVRHNSSVLTQAEKSPSLMLWGIGVPLMLLSTGGFAALMAWMPTPTGASRDTLSDSSVESANPGTAVNAAALQAKGTARRKAKCGECGLIVSMRETPRQGEALLISAADKPRAENRNDTPPGSASREITIRLDDGSSRVIVDTNPAKWRLGERVTVILGEPTR